MVKDFLLAVCDVAWLAMWLVLFLFVAVLLAPVVVIDTVVRSIKR